MADIPDNLNIDSIRSLFKDPPRVFGPTPFLALNDDLDPERLTHALREFHHKGCAGVFMHARTGLEIDYLSEQWWDRVGLVIEECKRLGLKAWIYDEYNWPSGAGGGKALQGRPEFLMPCIEYLHMNVKDARVPDHPGRAMAAFKIGNVIEDLSGNIESGKFKPPAGLKGELILFYKDLVTDPTFGTNNAPWCPDVDGCLDLMNPEAVEHFMELTHHQYEKRFPEHLGATVPGLFTDEPQFYRGFPWTNGLDLAFRDIKGYDLIERLYLLVLDRRGHRRLRSDFYGVVEHLYAKALFQKVRQWCDRNGLVFTGHMGMEERLTQMAINHGGIYRPMKSMSMPGIDALGKGNPALGGLINMESPSFAPRAAASISNTFSDGRVLCESGGGSGWQATPATLKAQLDWLFASGVNFVNPHQSLLSVKGLRKRDFPPSHFEQQPWFRHYKIFSGYVARASMVTSAGRPLKQLALLFPMASIRSLQRTRGDRHVRESMSVILPFHNVMDFLAANQREFELVFEEYAQDGVLEARDGKLRLGESEFSVLVVPPCPVMESAMSDVLARFLSGGGKLLLFGPAPARDTNENDVLEKLLPLVRKAAQEGRAVQVTGDDDFTGEWVLSALDRLQEPDLKVDWDYKHYLLYQRRRTNHADLYFFANMGEGRGRAWLSFRDSRPVLERWDPVSGCIAPLPFQVRDDRRAWANIFFHPGESTVLVFREKREDEKTPSILRTNLEILELGRDRIKGISADPSIEIVTASEKVEKKNPLPLPLVITPQWTISPHRKNLMLIRHWDVRTKKTKPLPLRGMWSEPRFVRRTRALILAGRVFIRLVSLVRPPQRRYRTERYFNFERVEGMTGQASRITGIDLDGLGLYQGAAILSRVGDYLGMPTAMRSFPPQGAEYTAVAVFNAEYVPDDLALVCEDLGVPVSFQINGKSLQGEPVKTDAWDPACRACKVSDLVRPGSNTLVMKSRQMDWNAMPPNTHSIEPVALSGSFAVKGGVIKKPDPGPAREGDWTRRGHPAYSGAMTYTCKFNLPPEYLDFHLELELMEVRQCAQVWINGAHAGVRIFPPFTFQASGLLREGENEIEVEVVNTAANVFAGPGSSGITGPVRIVPYGLHEVEMEGADDEPE